MHAGRQRWSATQAQAAIYVYKKHTHRDSTPAHLLDAFYFSSGFNLLQPRFGITDVYFLVTLM